MKFFEHFWAIARAMDQQGLWNEEDGLYYSAVHRPDGSVEPIRAHSIDGLLPLAAFVIVDGGALDRLPALRERVDWFPERYGDELDVLTEFTTGGDDGRRLMSVFGRERLERMLQRMLAAGEFLSPHGLRAVSGIPSRSPARLRRLRDPRLRARRVDDGDVRRQLELARADLVPDELPADRGARPARPLLRGRVHGRAARRLRATACGSSTSPASARRRLVSIFTEDADRPAAGVRRAARCSRTTRSGTTCSRSTSTSTATPAPASARRTRPGGRRSSPT